jgi:hypothetical protein
MYKHVIVRLIKLRRIKWAGQIAWMGNEFWWERLREADHLEDLGVDEKIKLKWVSK